MAHQWQKLCWFCSLLSVALFCSKRAVRGFGTACKVLGGCRCTHQAWMMELGPQDHTKHGLSEPTSMIVLSMEPLGTLLGIRVATSRPLVVVGIA